MNLSQRKQYDIRWANRNVPIRDVARTLGIHVINGRRARCWRHDDKNPSVGFKGNRYQCFVCDGRLCSVVDLVMSKLDCTAREAAAWLAETGYRIPLFGVDRRNHPGYVAQRLSFDEVSDTEWFRLLPLSAKSVLVEVFRMKRERGYTFSFSAEEMAARAGVSRNSVPVAMRTFERVGMLTITQGKIRADNKRAPNSYALHIGNPEFQSVLSIGAYEHAILFRLCLKVRRMQFEAAVQSLSTLSRDSLCIGRVTSAQPLGMAPEMRKVTSAQPLGMDPPRKEPLTQPKRRPLFGSWETA